MALAQPAGGADAGESGADDQDVEVFGARQDVVSLRRQQYPIINADTLRCLAPPAPRAPGVVATLVR